MIERTLLLLKPDGVEKDLERVIAEEVAALGLRVIDRKKMRLHRAIVTEHYAHHANKPFFPGLCAYMTRGPVIALIVEGDAAVAKIRDLVGATDPSKAAPESIRARFGRKLPDGRVENVVHASEKPEEAEVEIKRFFGVQDSWWNRLVRWFKPTGLAA